MLKLLYFILTILLQVFLAIVFNIFITDYEWWVIDILVVLIYFVGYAEGEKED